MLRKKPKIVKRVTLDQVKNDKRYTITDPTTGKYVTGKAEIIEEWVEVHPRSITFVHEDGELFGLIYDTYIIEEAKGIT